LVAHFGFKWLWFSVGAVCIGAALLVKKLKSIESREVK
jgi:hypothetical protein